MNKKKKGKGEEKKIVKLSATERKPRKIPHEVETLEL